MDFLGVSRKKPQVGDIFVFKNKYLGYIYGRVILGEDWQGPMSKGEDFLLYIYNHITKEIESDPVLDKNNLLIDPEICNRRGWLDGYFKTIKHKELTKDDLLSQHCFIEVPYENGKAPRYVDENGKLLVVKNEPCGVYASSTHRMIDDLISEKMKLTFAKVSNSDGIMPSKIKWW
ncbi:MAG: Imm26 family immunity protein [Minisyncoccia bacterium]